MYNYTVIIKIKCNLIKWCNSITCNYLFSNTAYIYIYIYNWIEFTLNNKLHLITVMPIQLQYIIVLYLIIYLLH